MRKLATLFGLMILTFSAQAQAPRSNEPIPYIYYYSIIENAIVIERADGTDSHLIAKDVMPENHNEIYNVSWSPSGEWMAWESSYWAGPGNSPNIAWVARTDGTEVIQMTNDEETSFYVVWSPLNDYLFVINEIKTRQNDISYKIFNPQSNIILAEFTVYTPRENTFMSPVSLESPQYGWSEDGASVYFPSIRGVYQMFLNGKTNVWFGSEDDPIGFHNGILISGARRDDGEYVILSRDLNHGTAHIIDNIDIEFPDSYEFIWTDDGTKGVGKIVKCNTSPCQWQFVYLNVDTSQHLIFPSEYNFADPYYGDCMWSNCYDSWSPDAKVVLLQNEDKQVVIFNTETMQIMREIDLRVNHWQWSDYHLFLNLDDELYRYDWTADVMIPIKHESNFGNPIPSPNGRYMLPWEGDVVIQDIETGEQQRWVRHPMTTSMGPITGAKWSDDSQWFFSGGNTQITDSCCIASFIMLHKVGESSRRELAKCLVVDTCTGFVPDHVLPNLAIENDVLTPIPQPILTLEHSIDTFAVTWNATGTNIATCGMKSWEEYFLYIWSVSAAEPVLEETHTIAARCENLIWNSENTIIVQASSTSETKATESGIYEISEEIISLYDQRFSDFIFVETTNDQLTTLTLQDRLTQEAVFTTNLGGVSMFALTHDKLQIALAGRYGATFVYDVTSGELVETIYKAPSDLAFSPDGTLLAISGTQWVTIYDLSEQ